MTDHSERVAVWARAIDVLPAGDPELAHSLADDVLLAAAPPEVQAAYERLQARCEWWACA